MGGGLTLTRPIQPVADVASSLVVAIGLFAGRASYSAQDASVEPLARFGTWRPDPVAFDPEGHVGLQADLTSPSVIGRVAAPSQRPLVRERRVETVASAHLDCALEQTPADKNVSARRRGRRVCGVTSPHDPSPSSKHRVRGPALGVAMWWPDVVPGLPRALVVVLTAPDGSSRPPSSSADTLAASNAGRRASRDPSARPSPRVAWREGVRRSAERRGRRALCPALGAPRTHGPPGTVARDELAADPSPRSRAYGCTAGRRTRLMIRRSLDAVLARERTRGPQRLDMTS